jgi:hypothetical protein
MKRGRPRKDESLDDHLLVAASRKGARSSSRESACVDAALLLYPSRDALGSEAGRLPSGF